MHLGKTVLDIFGRVTDCDVRQQVEVDGHTGELIEVIDRLWTDDLLGRCYSAQRHEIGCSAGGSGDGAAGRSAVNRCAASVAAHIKIVQIGRLGALVVFDFEDDLILVLGLFNQVDVVLRVGGAQQTLHRGSRDAVSSSALAVDIDGQIGSVVIEIGAHRSETFETAQLVQQ